MSGEPKMYGAKCHRCGCLAGPTHDVEPIVWLPTACARCSFCQERALSDVMRRHGGDIFSPEIRQAARDFRDGRANPIIDQLRAEIQAEERTGIDVMIEITHIAGLVITLDGHVRQRCAWCSTILIDEDLANVAVPDNQPDKSFPTWPEGRLVSIRGNTSWTPGDTQPLPITACARLEAAL